MSDWIVDTDAGIDDAQALVLALSSERMSIRSIACVMGNTSLPNVYRNVSEVLRICNREEIPVYKGCDRPMVAKYISAADYHSEDGLGDYWLRTGRQSPKPDEPTEHTAVAIVRMIREKLGTSIIALGPLTNISTALIIDPELPIGKLIVMGGTHHSDGNVGPVQEFNFVTDPEAAYIVFERARDITMVPWETCAHVEVIPTREFLESWCIHGNPKGEFLAEIIGLRLDKLTHITMCDAIAVAIAIEPTLVLEEHSKFVTIELSGTVSRGQTVVFWDRFGWLKLKNLYATEHVKIVGKVDGGGLFQMLAATTLS